MLNKTNLIDILLKEARIKKSHNTSVQQAIIDACEPMIEFLCDKAEKEIEEVIKEIKQDMANPDLNEMTVSSFDTKPTKIDIDWVIKNEFKIGSFKTEVLYHTFDYPKKDHSNNLPKEDYLIQQHRYKITLSEISLNLNKKNKFIENSRQDIKTFNLMKLTEAIKKYISSDFTKLLTGRIEQGPQGFEFFGTILDNQDRTWTFHTRAIGAGGYNIQQYHYRYIIKLSSPQVSTSDIRQKINDQAKAEKEQKQQEKLLEKQNKITEKSIKKIISTIKAMGSDYKNALIQIKFWTPLMNDDDKLRDFLKNSEFGPMNILSNDDENLTNSIISFKKRINSNLEDYNNKIQNYKDAYNKFYDNKGKARFSKEQLYNMIAKGEITKADYNNYQNIYM